MTFHCKAIIDSVLLKRKKFMDFSPSFFKVSYWCCWALAWSLYNKQDRSRMSLCSDLSTTWSVLHNSRLQVVEGTQRKGSKALLLQDFSPSLLQTGRNNLCLLWLLAVRVHGAIGCQFCDETFWENSWEFEVLITLHWWWVEGLKRREPYLNHADRFTYHRNYAFCPTCAIWQPETQYSRFMWYTAEHHKIKIRGGSALPSRFHTVTKCKEWKRRLSKANGD